jgi:predicted nucleic acid-binding protein
MERRPRTQYDDFQLTSEVAVKHADMELGLTDASIVVQAARHKTTGRVAAADRHRSRFPLVR